MIEDTTAQRLATLAQLYQQGQASQLMDRTLDKLLAHEAEEARAQLVVLAADLAAFEQQYEMSSAEFARRYEAGQTDDRMDFVEWASLVRMRDNLQQRLQLLTGEHGACPPPSHDGRSGATLPGQPLDIFAVPALVRQGTA